MSPRRAKGTGGVSRRHDHPTCPPLVDGKRPSHRCRGRWVAVYELPPLDGKRRRRVLYARTRREAVEKLEAVLAQEFAQSSRQPGALA